MGQSISVTAIFGPTNQQYQTDDYSIGFGNGTTIVWGNGCNASYNTGSLSTSKPVTVVQSVTVPATVTSGSYTSLNVVGIQDSTYLCGSSTILGSVSLSICSSGGPDLRKPSSSNSGGITPSTPTQMENETSNRKFVIEPNISLYGTPIKFMVPLNQPVNFILTLYSIAGEAVYHESMEGNQGMNTMVWNLENQNGSNVASGLYIYVITFPTGTQAPYRIGKVVVIH